MRSRTKEAAIAEQTAALAEGVAFSTEHTYWIFTTGALLEEVFGRNSSYYKNFVGLTWRPPSGFIIGGLSDPEGSLDPARAMKRERQKAYLSQLNTAQGLLLAAADHLERLDLQAVYEGKDTPPESSALVKVINLVEHNVRKVIRERPEQERGVQDALENLLIGADLSYSREAERIEYSSKTCVPDFTLPKIDLAIDVKLCANENRQTQMIAEINDDILAYQTKFGNLLFVVYDLGFIRDIERFVDSFEKHQNVIVRVVKH